MLAGITDIKERNEYFHALDPQSQRMEIAWDALQLMLNGQITAAYGHYWNTQLAYMKNTATSAEHLQKKLLTQLTPACSVCQRGLIMVSLIRVGNNLNPRAYGIHCGENDNLVGFSLSSMERMEGLYEGFSPEKSLMHPFQPNTPERMANICCNVLVNGDFDENDKTKYITP